jgi:hypothetical protein
MIGGRGYEVAYPPFVVSRAVCCNGTAFPPWHRAHVRFRHQGRQTAGGGVAGRNNPWGTPEFSQLASVAALLIGHTRVSGRSARMPSYRPQPVSAPRAAPERINRELGAVVTAAAVENQLRRNAEQTLHGVVPEGRSRYVGVGDARSGGRVMWHRP